MAWFFIIGILFLAIGLVFFLKPEVIWKITEQWKSNYSDEPSELYKKSTKFGGIMFFCVGIACIAAAFF